MKLAPGAAARAAAVAFAGALGLLARPSGGLIAAAATRPPPSAPPPELAWAYPVAPPGTPELKTPRGVYSTPDGRRRLAAAQVDALKPADEDWFPRSHPKPPPVVLGRTSTGGPAPCAECHRVDGRGVVRVPDLAGLRADYILEQLRAFRSGARTSAEPRLLGPKVMARVARSWPEPDLKAAAAYFSSLPRHATIRIVAGDAAPPMKAERFGWTYRDPAGGRPRPLGGAVAEAPETVAGVFLGDLSDRQLVYVSARTLARGAALARDGGGGGQPCAFCHGPGLRGTAVAPPLAGRDPAYLARQIWDIRSGARSGPGVALMLRPARGLAPRDVAAVAAYLSSLDP